MAIKFIVMVILLSTIESYSIYEIIEAKFGNDTTPFNTAVPSTRRTQLYLKLKKDTETFSVLLVYFKEIMDIGSYKIYYSQDGTDIHYSALTDIAYPYHRARFERGDRIRDNGEPYRASYGIDQYTFIPPKEDSEFFDLRENKTKKPLSYKLTSILGTFITDIPNWDIPLVENNQLVDYSQIVGRFFVD